MRKLKYKNVQEMIENIVIKEKANYFICECPDCNGHEAYIYKTNLNSMKCSRANECGSEFVIKYEIEDKEYNFIKSEQVIASEIEMSKKITNILNSVNKNIPDDIIYRGLEKEILSKADVYVAKPGTKIEVDFKSEDIAIFGTETTKLQIKSSKYDLIFPFKNNNEEITRLIYRSFNDDQYVKEYCKPLVQQSADVLKIDLDNDVIFVSESILDGLSLKQSYDAGLFACRGITKVNSLIYDLSKDFNFWKDKTLLIGFDSDAAGEKFSKSLSDKCEELGIEYIKLNVPNNVKDWNDILKLNGKEYVSSTIDNQIRNKLENYLENNDASKLERLSARHMENCLKNDFLRDYYVSVASSQHLVGPVNSMILDLQYENSFFANEEILKKLSDNVPTKDFDCKILIQNDTKVFEKSNGEKISLNDATEYDQQKLKSGEYKISTKSNSSISTNKFAISKDMFKRVLNVEKANNFISSVLENYKFNNTDSYIISESNNLDFNYVVDDNKITFNSNVNDEKKFAILTSLLIKKNENIDDSLSSCSTKFFLSNFYNLSDSSWTKDINSLSDLRQVMKNNHSLLSFFEENNLFEYEIQTIKKMGLEDVSKGGDIKFNQSPSTIE